MSKSGTRIAVVDSGVGGFSILEEIRSLLPNATYLYYMDRKNFPYGSKSESEVLKVVDDICEFLISQYHPTLCVIACNTASTICLPHLREKFGIPFVGVVPAIKPAAQQSRSKKISLLATSGTVQRKYVKDLIATHASECEIFDFGSEELVKLAEEKYLLGKDILQDLEGLLGSYLSNAVSANVDVGVLGCTHFSFLKQELFQIEPKIEWLDSAKAIASRVLDICTEIGVSGTSASLESKLLISKKINNNEELTLRSKFSDFCIEFRQ